MVDVAVIAGLIGALSLVRTRLKSYPLTLPMILVLAGVVLGSEVAGVLELEVDDESVALLAEFALALLLFSDASRINVSSMRSVFSLPTRLLFIGLPLTVLMGAVVATRLLDTLSVYEAALIAVILAPTDAALGEAVVSNRAVPVRIRQALNIESGLNDGLVVPVVSILVVLVVGRELESPTTLVWGAVREIGLGVVIGGGVAWVLARLLSIAEVRKWTDSEGARLATFGSVLLVFSGTSLLDGNGFIAAFVCGALLRRFLPGAATRVAELSEDLGQVAASVVFVVFGAVLVVPSIEALSWRVVVCALLTLTVGRMLPVAVAAFGTNLRWPTVAFLGWFGPRGLASIVFGLLFVNEYGDEVERAEEILAVVVLVVVLSVLLHGVTAAYGARKYSEWFHHHENPDLLEAMAVADDPMRGER